MPILLIAILIVWTSLILFVVFNSIRRIKQINKLTVAPKQSQDFNSSVSYIKQVLDLQKSQENITNIDQAYQLAVPLWKQINFQKDYHKLFKILMTATVEMNNKTIAESILRSNYLNSDDLHNYKLLKYSGPSEKRKNSSIQNQILNN